MVSEREAGQIWIATEEPLVIEKFSRFAPLGRFLLMKENKVIAVGIIV